MCLFIYIKPRCNAQSKGIARIQLGPFGKFLNATRHTLDMSAIMIKTAIAALMLPRSTRSRSGVEEVGQPNDKWSTEARHGAGMTMWD